ncbi:MAG: hypothetical protein AABY27_02665, partial [Pseudomonadota bacterium]
MGSQNITNNSNSTYVAKKHLAEYFVFINDIIQHCYDKLESSAKEDFILVNDEMKYSSQNKFISPSLVLKFVNNDINKAFALTLKEDSLYLVYNFGSFKLATVNNKEFKLDKFITILEEFDLELEGDYLFTKKDHKVNEFILPANSTDVIEALDDNFAEIRDKMIESLRINSVINLKELYELNISFLDIINIMKAEEQTVKPSIITQIYDNIIEYVEAAYKYAEANPLIVAGGTVIIAGGAAAYYFKTPQANNALALIAPSVNNALVVQPVVQQLTQDQLQQIINALAPAAAELMKKSSSNVITTDQVSALLMQRNYQVPNDQQLQNLATALSPVPNKNNDRRTSPRLKEKAEDLGNIVNIVAKMKNGWSDQILADAHADKLTEEQYNNIRKQVGSSCSSRDSYNNYCELYNQVLHSPQADDTLSTYDNDNDSLDNNQNNHLENKQLFEKTPRNKKLFERETPAARKKVVTFANNEVPQTPGNALKKTVQKTPGTTTPSRGPQANAEVMKAGPLKQVLGDYEGQEEIYNLLATNVLDNAKENLADRAVTGKIDAAVKKIKKSLFTRENFDELTDNLDTDLATYLSKNIKIDKDADINKALFDVILFAEGELRLGELKKYFDQIKFNLTKQKQTSFETYRKIFTSTFKFYQDVENKAKGKTTYKYVDGDGVSKFALIYALMIIPQVAAGASSFKETYHNASGSF